MLTKLFSMSVSLIATSFEVVTRNLDFNFAYIDLHASLAHKKTFNFKLLSFLF